MKLKSIKGECPICPECGHYNAMLEGDKQGRSVFDPIEQRYEDRFTCRDCGFSVLNPEIEFTSRSRY